MYATSIPNKKIDSIRIVNIIDFTNNNPESFWKIG